jgi:hypothetical protein
VRTGGGFLALFQQPSEDELIRTLDLSGFAEPVLSDANGWTFPKQN